MRFNVVGLVTSLLLFVMLLPSPASAGPTFIYISDDANGGDCTTVGNWDWPTMTCTLTQDVFADGAIVMEDDYVTLDCDGHTVTGPGIGGGINLKGRTGVAVENCHVTNFSDGFWIHESDGNNLWRNTAEGNDLGFRLYYSDGNNLEWNTAYDNDLGFHLEEADGNNLEWNTAEGNDLGFWFYESSSNRLSRNRAEGNTIGFLLDSSEGNNLRSNRAQGNDYGFYLDSSDGNRLRSNRASRNDYGFFLLGSDGNLLYENAGRRNAVFDAFQTSSTGNRWIRNRFGTTYGIP